MNTTQVKAYAMQDATSRLAPFTIPRREAGATDVAIDGSDPTILYAATYQRLWRVPPTVIRNP